MSRSLLCCDLDGTLVGKPDATLTFRSTWLQLRQASGTDAPYLVYNTGRLLEDTRSFIRKVRLPEPDFLICGMGTVVWNCQTRKFMDEFSANLVEGWDIKRVDEVVGKFPGVERQPEVMQHSFKSSWYLYDVDEPRIDQLRRELRESGLDVVVHYSNAHDLNVLPRNADKGKALDWLVRHLGVSLKSTYVAGDGCNDAPMFLLPGAKGILVGNADANLFEATVSVPTFTAEGVCADGVLEGMLHYGLISEIVPPADRNGKDMAQFDPSITMLFDSNQMAALEPEQREFIRLAFLKAVEAIHKTVTPLGFSACSLSDNEVTGTDANYHSVWGRDGAIAVIGSLPLQDQAIRRCQQQTLRTLLDHVTPNGQIPSNVRLADGEPDYSGVGGIASIDSGLWVIIAFYEFIRETEDFDFLQEYADRLQKAMDWLSAQDSNNDALLEIPEAGDWTDLFGRSYNVLYDEILWYRTNVCYGRLKEWMGEYEKAGDYLRWAQKIKQAILRKFWPSTRPTHDGHAISFADRQFSLGDTQYLLAEVTPFSFNWRCDVYGNILAFLFNVIDHNQAQTAFRFMWGVGVNEPYPVANLYPVVSSGDPDWRSYYTVNLLNLPHHYHNGGIWPFIGAQWVRFIHRLGLRDIAHRELYKLAKANHLGKAHEWEFNEWIHGTTGRPMGKAYQAWSSSEFILACHELGLDPETVKD